MTTNTEVIHSEEEGNHFYLYTKSRVYVVRNLEGVLETFEKGGDVTRTGLSDAVFIFASTGALQQHKNKLSPLYTMVALHCIEAHLHNIAIC